MPIFANFPGGEDMANISENRSGERIGKRIEKIRESREMSRSELGKEIGLDTTRIRQYEVGSRKAKVPLLKKFADALGVETLALMDPTIETYVGTMYALFEMEEKLDLKITMKDGCYCLQFGDGKHDGINRYLENWYDAQQKKDENWANLTDEERKKKIFDYNMFEWTYPSGIAINADKKYYEHPINRVQELEEERRNII